MTIRWSHCLKASVACSPDLARGGGGELRRPIIRARSTASKIFTAAGLTSVRGTAALLRERRKILLAALKRRGFRARSALPIHAKPKNRYEHARDSGGNVLRDLQISFARKLGDAAVVGFDFGGNGRAVQIWILRLNDGDRLRRASRAGAQYECKR